MTDLSEGNAYTKVPLPMDVYTAGLGAMFADREYSQAWE